MINKCFLALVLVAEVDQILLQGICCKFCARNNHFES